MAATGIPCCSLPHMPPLIRPGDTYTPRLLAGTVVVALILGTSRWGTNLGYSPLFISDVLIALSVMHLLLSRQKLGPLERRPDSRSVTPLFGVFMLFVIARVITSATQASPLDWLRDAVPFLYGIMAFVSAYAIARSDDATRHATMRVFRWALTIHVLWVAAVWVTGNSGGFDILGPLSSAPLLQVRPDIDVALIAIAAGINLRQVVLGRRRGWNLLGLALCVVTVFLWFGTRAGQVSFLLALSASFIFTFAASRNFTKRQLLMVMVVPILITATLLVLPSTTAGQRLIATVAPAFAQGTDGQINAQGTQRARELTWSAVIDWTNEDVTRAVVGSGFGNNFLEQAGVLHLLEGTTYENVRSPHNWFVGIYARLGIIGAGLAIAWVASLFWTIWRIRRRVGQDELLAFSALTVIAIIPVAALGVVLEAPFGAIPFFWAAGVLMSSREPKNQRFASISRNRDRVAARE